MQSAEQQWSVESVYRSCEPSHAKNERKARIHHITNIIFRASGPRDEQGTLFQALSIASLVAGTISPRSVRYLPTFVRDIKKTEALRRFRVAVAEADLRDIVSLRKIASNCDIGFHCAAITAKMGDPHFLSDERSGHEE